MRILNIDVVYEEHSVEWLDEECDLYGQCIQYISPFRHRENERVYIPSQAGRELCSPAHRFSAIPRSVQGAFSEGRGHYTSQNLATEPIHPVWAVSPPFGKRPLRDIITSALSSNGISFLLDQDQ